MTMIDTLKITSDIKSFAFSLGFDDIGFTKAEILNREGDKVKKWIDSGYHASMNYMERNIDKRYDAGLILQDARTVIVTIMNYYPGNHPAMPNETGKIARYAWGRDYHDVIFEKLNSICDFIYKNYHKNSKAYVDTGPILEKAWAVKAGIGWQGKNSLVLSKENGSYFFLGIIISELETVINQPVTEHCGSCRKCIDACPTNAIVKPKVVDSNKCISFWTIEAKPNLSFPPNVTKNLKGWLFGCDICQEVCPWNKKAKLTKETAFNDYKASPFLLPEEINYMNEQEFKNRFEGTPIKRLKLSGLLRNINELKNNESK